jgi:hypothetical protein
MLEGNLRDVSLPGLLSFLCNESSKAYLVSLLSEHTRGELVVLKGTVVHASMGLLEGEDALCEFIFLHEGLFRVETLNGAETKERRANLKVSLKHSDFVEYAAFLADEQVGLNTTVLPSSTFGSPEWQESLALQPLKKEDYSVLSWLQEGRTMRQAMRELGLSFVEATEVLYRLVLTHSVESQEITAQQLTMAATAPPGGGEKIPAAQPIEKAVSRAQLKEQMQRTEAMPIVCIDIERLFKATFETSKFGQLALTNPSLDENLRNTLNHVQAGNTIPDVLALEHNRSAAAVLSTVRYCLDRGYVTCPDEVAPITADLLLKRMEIDQYLVQRRRITGDALRQVVDRARQEGRHLADLLITSGYLTKSDVERLEREQKRFSAI